MIDWRLSHQEPHENDRYHDPKDRENVRCKIFLGYASSQVSSGMREVIRYLAQHKMV